jgi:hypothetical protein
MSARYKELLDLGLGATLSVDFTTIRGRVVDYAIVLLVATPGGPETVRVYDGAHGHNEMHRYTEAGGKQEGTKFHSGTLGEGMRDAMDAIKRSHLEMIEGWRGQR